MKKIFWAAMTLVIAVFASCSNDDAQLEGIGDFKVNFTVADKAGFDGDTRAVKTGWENGDQILIVMQGKEDVWCGANGYNYFKLQYNGSSWTADVTGLNKELLESGKKFSAIYHPGAITVVKKYDDHPEYYLTGYKGGEDLCNSTSGSTTYTYTGGTIDLGDIVMIRHSQAFQISVKDLASKGRANGIWQLWIKNEGGEKASRIYCSPADFAFLSETGTFSAFAKNYSSGINYADDVVFYFTNAGCTETPLTFELTDGTNTYIYTSTTIPEKGYAYTLPAITDAKWTKTK